MALLGPVFAALNDAGARYAVVGSVASSAPYPVKSR